MEDLEEALSRCSFGAFIATADDTVVSRGTKKISPRDNIVFEFGLFAGRLGRGRTFLLVPDEASDLKLPSDLLGITMGSFSPGGTVADRREGMASIAEEIVEKIEQQGPLDAPSDPALANELLGSVSSQLSALSKIGRPSLDQQHRDTWARQVLVAALEPFLARTPDAYAAWLRPDENRRLAVNLSVNVPKGYNPHRWAQGEGLAGRVWDTGESAAVSTLEKHPWYEQQPGCENESYVCAAVGGPAGGGGILAIGSDSGFSINHGDLGLVRAYAAILDLVSGDPAGPTQVLADVASDVSGMLSSVARRVTGH